MLKPGSVSPANPGKKPPQATALYHKEERVKKQEK